MWQPVSQRKTKNDVVLNFFPLVAMCGNTVSPRKTKK